MYLYNSLTHKKELFVPNDPDHGENVHLRPHGVPLCPHRQPAHLHHGGCAGKVPAVSRAITSTRVMNITDVGHLSSDADTGEDKMLKGARREHKTVMEIAKFYTDAFFADCDKLNIKRPDVVEPATNCIERVYPHGAGACWTKAMPIIAGRQRVL